MKYTLEQVNQSRFAPDRSEARKMAERFIPLNLIGKIVSPFPTYIFLNLGIHPDVVTFFSIFCIIAGCLLLFLGQGTAGVSFFLLFILFDSVDGDVARVKGPSLYGSVLDSFGADVFYSLTPVTIGFYLFQMDTYVGILTAPFVLLSGAFVSVSFVLYRLINAKVFHFRSRVSNQEINHKQVAKNVVTIKSVVKCLELGRHVVLRGNFFSEPGLAFWFFVFIFFAQYKALAWYLVIILIYNSVYLLMNFVGAYLYFRHSEHLPKH